MNKSLFFAAALAFGLTACKAMEFDHEPRLNEHNIVVSVFNDASGTPRIDVDVPELHIRGQDHVIFWEIQNKVGQSYTFPTNGIVFTSGQSQFDCDRQNLRKFKCKDKGTEKGKFKYVVTLDGSPAVKPLDPFIVNN